MPQVLQRNALLDISACPKAAMTTSVELQTLTKQSREWCVGVGVVVVWYHLSGLARCLSRQSVVVLCAQTTSPSLRLQGCLYECLSIPRPKRSAGATTSDEFGDNIHSNRALLNKNMHVSQKPAPFLSSFPVRILFYDSATSEETVQKLLSHTVLYIICLWV